MPKAQKKILIVEDEVLLLNVLRKKFVSEGFEVLQAINGKEGLKIALHQKPDLILLDIVMPVMDGMTMLKKLHEDEWGKTVPVIILTNLNDVGDVGRASKEGVYNYLVKADWHIDDVVKKVREKLGN